MICTKKGNYKKDSKFFNEKIILKGKHVEPMFLLYFNWQHPDFSCCCSHLFGQKHQILHWKNWMWLRYKIANKYIQTIKTAYTNGLYTTSDKHKKLILSEEILKEYRVCSVLELRKRGSTDCGKVRGETAP